MTAQIKQQEAAVEMIRMKVSAGRAPSSRLEAAINELNRLRSELAVTKHQAPTGVPVPTGVPLPKRAPAPRSPIFKAIMADVAKDPVELRQAALSEQATRIRAKQSELSNMLHKVPQDQPCPELVEQILNLHNQVENIWTQKHFLERNKTDGPANPDPDQQVVHRSVESVAEKAELTVKLQKLREKHSKLTAKLRNPTATAASKTKWEIELAQVKAAIEECIQKRTLI